MTDCNVLLEDCIRIGENYSTTFGFADDSDLTDWSCTIQLRNKTDVATAIINRVVTDTNGANTRFLINLTPAETSALAEGDYILGMELANATTNENKEGLIELKVIQSWVF